MSNFSKTTLAAAALATVIPFTAFSVPAQAQVTGCNASGGRQEAGALIGALAGGVLGSNLAKNERGLGTVAGAAAGAAAGSYIGCQQQMSRASTQAAASAGAYGTGRFFATTAVNVRSGPSVHSSRVSRLNRNESFDVVSRNGNWALIAQNGYNVGYVSSTYIRPV